MKFVKFTDAENRTPIIINLDDVQSFYQDRDYTVVSFRGEKTCVTLRESMTEVSKRIQEAQSDHVRFY